MERGYVVHGPVHKHLCGTGVMPQLLKKIHAPNFFSFYLLIYMLHIIPSALHFVLLFFVSFRRKSRLHILVFRMYLSQLPLTGCTFTSQKIQNGRLEMREKRMKNFPVPQAMSRLADYFIVIGYDHDKDSKYFL